MKGDSTFALLLILVGGGVAWYFWQQSQQKVTIGTTSNPILVPGVGPVAVDSPTTGAAVQQGPGQLIYGPTDTQLGVSGW
jgi:hypothetical protein